jgi:hypothetical protein
MVYCPEEWRGEGKKWSRLFVFAPIPPRGLEGVIFRGRVCASCSGRKQFHSSSQKRITVDRESSKKSRVPQLKAFEQSRHRHHTDAEIYMVSTCFISCFHQPYASLVKRLPEGFHMINNFKQDGIMLLIKNHTHSSGFSVATERQKQFIPSNRYPLYCSFSK